MTDRSYNRAMSLRTRNRNSPAAAATRRPAVFATLATLCLAFAVSGCGLFSNQPSPHRSRLRPARRQRLHVSTHRKWPQLRRRPPVRFNRSPWWPTWRVAGGHRKRRSLAGRGAGRRRSWGRQLDEGPHFGGRASTQIQTTATTSPSIVVTVGAQAAAATWTAALANPSVQSSRSIRPPSTVRPRTSTQSSSTNRDGYLAV